MVERDSGRARRGFLVVQVLTVARIPLAVVFAAVVLGWERRSFALVLCLALLVAIELTDFLDGILARRLGIVSELGAMLDPYADSLTRLIVYWALACAGMVIPFVPLAMALRDVTVAYSRIVLSRSGRSVSAKWSGKIKAGVQGAGALLAVLGPFYWERTGLWTIQALSWTVIAVTAASIFEYAAAAVSSIDRNGGGSAEGSTEHDHRPGE